MAEKRKNTLSERLIGASLTRTGEQAIPGHSDILSGNLSEKPINWLLEAADHHEVTGHLSAGTSYYSVVIQFGLGTPVHAYSPMNSGLEAIIELFTWSEGRVTFKDGPQPEAASVQISVDKIIRAGYEYLENMEFLERNAITELAILQRAPEKLSDEEFARALQAIGQEDVEKHREFFGNVYGFLNLKDVADKMSLSQSSWMSMAANLLKLGILLSPDGRSLGSLPQSEAPPVPGPGDKQSDSVGWVDPMITLGQAPASSKPADQSQAGSGGLWVPPEVLDSSTQTPSYVPDKIIEFDGIQGIAFGIPPAPAPVDRAGGKRAGEALLNSSTGIVDSGGFQYLLELEFTRAFRFKSIFALVLLCVDLDIGSAGSIPANNLNLVVDAISFIKRDVDTLGHFDKQILGLILPLVDSTQACSLVDRIITELPSRAQELGQYKPTFHFGIASVPQDGQDVSSLVAAAQAAMLEAARTKVTRMLHSELRPEQ